MASKRYVWVVNTTLATTYNKTSIMSNNQAVYPFSHQLPVFLQTSGTFYPARIEGIVMREPYGTRELKRTVA
jgi:hypothetical protein